MTINLPAQDMEGDSLTYLIRNPNNFAALPSQFTVSVDTAEQKVTLTPVGAFEGTATVRVAVRDQTRRIDTNGDNQINEQDILNVQPNFDTEVITVVVTANSHTNPVNSRDVNNDSLISPIDALLVINELTNRDVSDPVTGELQVPTSPPANFLDVNADGLLTPIDALLVINELPSTSAQSSSVSLPISADEDEEKDEDENSMIDSVWADWE